MWSSNRSANYNSLEQHVGATFFVADYPKLACRCGSRQTRGSPAPGDGYVGFGVFNAFFQAIRQPWSLRVGAN